MSIPKHIRVLCGCFFIAAGYYPNLADMFVNEVSADVLSYKNLKSPDFFQTVFCENSLENGELARELLQNKMSYDSLHVASNNSTKNFNSLSPNNVKVNYVKTILSKGFVGSKFASGEIASNFYVDAYKLGVPAQVIDCVISKLSSRINFKHALKRGDKFEIIYDKKNVMLYSKITTRRNQASVYKFPYGNSSSYYFENGTSVTAGKSNSFGQPLKGKLHVSSSFGKRIHPISGVYKMHTGVDLKAPSGSPVYAIFDGVVVRASNFFGYGNCVDIKHPSGYKSRYAHLSRYNVRCGLNVRKGQIIGYSGTSGTTIGPHLHLELAKNDRVVNPFVVKMMQNGGHSAPKGFNNLKKQIERIVSPR